MNKCVINIKNDIYHNLKKLIFLIIIYINDYC
jgi:hypothetical protein